MPNLSQQTQELHAFPVPPELEGVNFVDLSRQAQDRFRGMIALMPLEKSEALSYGDNEVFVKRADLLPGGCFKFLSARTAVAELAERGCDDFTLATAGSYGVGVGYGLQAYGGRATAFVPEGSNPEKQGIMRELGVDVIKGGVNFDEANELARNFAQDRGSVYLHPFASKANLAGTGIIGLELAEQCPEMTHVVTQYGGGSLNGGVGAVLKELRPDVHVAAVQVLGCSPFVESLLSGEVEEAEDRSSHIMSSFFSRLGGVGVGKTHPMTLGLGSRVVNSADTVSSGHVYATMHDFEAAHGFLPEFAAAVSLEGARKLARSPAIKGATIVAILTGGHPDSYPSGYLARKSSRRQGEEHYSRPEEPGLD